MFNFEEKIYLVIKTRVCPFHSLYIYVYVCTIQLFFYEYFERYLHEIICFGIGIGIYLQPKYQEIDLSQIYLQIIYMFFENKELFAKHCFKLT